MTWGLVGTGRCGVRRTRSRFAAAAIMLWCSAAIGFAGGAEELADYEPSPAAVRLVAEFERYHERTVQAAPSRERFTGDTQRWLERAAALGDDPPAQHYLLARGHRRGAGASHNRVEPLEYWRQTRARAQ